MGTRRLTDADIVRLAEMRERGRTMAVIARVLGCSISTVDYHCLRLGIEKPNPVRRFLQAGDPVIIVRGNHVVRRFTSAEDQQLQKHVRDGLSYAEIAKAIGRQYNSVRARAQAIARRESRLEAAE